MKIVKWLSPQSNRSGRALIRVEPGEDADIERMLILIDGDSAGHFGINAELVKTGEEEPTCTPTRVEGKIIGPDYLEPKMQFGFDNGSNLKNQVRYYNVFIAKD
jgi:hypothetical protein